MSNQKLTFLLFFVFFVPSRHAGGRIVEAADDARAIVAEAERRTDAKDRRAVLLALTPTGRRRARAMRRDLLEAAHELLAPIPADRRDAVGAALEELQVLLPKHSARR